MNLGRELRAAVLDQLRGPLAAYERPAVRAIFRGRSWQELNRPNQKQPIRDAFPRLKTLRLGPHTNLQLGDSGIARHFRALLLEPDLNPRGLRNPVGIYGAIARGEVAT